jgi:HSP20 family protein
MDTQREQRSKDTTQRTAADTTKKRDIERTPSIQHEVQYAPGMANLSELSRRNLDVVRDPFAMMNAFRREIDRFFDGFGLGGNLFRMPRVATGLERSFDDLGSSLWTPQIEVAEREGKLHVSADLPGLTKKDVHIEVLNGDLMIEGERQSEQRDERGGWSERSYGRFYRTIPLPDGINADTAKATFDNGVLDVTFEAPKPEKRHGKPIQIH